MAISFNVGTHSSVIRGYESDMKGLLGGLNSLTLGDDANRIVRNIGNISFEEWKDNVASVLQAILEGLKNKVEAISTDVSSGGFAAMKNTVSSLVSGLGNAATLKEAIERWEQYRDWIAANAYYIDDGYGNSIVNPEYNKAVRMIEELKARFEPVKDSCNRLFAYLAQIVFQDTSSGAPSVTLDNNSIPDVPEYGANNNNNSNTGNNNGYNHGYNNGNNYGVYQGSDEQGSQEQGLHDADTEKQGSTEKDVDTSLNLRDRGYPSSMDGYDGAEYISEGNDPYRYRTKSGGAYTSKVQLSNGDIVYGRTTKDDAVRTAINKMNRSNINETRIYYYDSTGKECTARVVKNDSGVYKIYDTNVSIGTSESAVHSNLDNNKTKKNLVEDSSKNTFEGYLNLIENYGVNEAQRIAKKDDFFDNEVFKSASDYYMTLSNGSN